MLYPASNFRALSGGFEGSQKHRAFLTTINWMEEGTGEFETGDNVTGTGANDILPLTRPERKRSVAMQEVIGFSKTAREIQQHHP